MGEEQDEFVCSALAKDGSGRRYAEKELFAVRRDAGLGRESRGTDDKRLALLRLCSRK